MKKILVTGGAGFIGRNLISSLINEYKVICVDNFLTSNFSNIEEFNKSTNFELIETDIIDLKHIDCDFIFNLACAASPVWYSKFHKETIKTCTEGVFNILKIAKDNKAKVFHASTSEVYGDPAISPQSEDYYGNVNSFGPRSCYDEGKRCAEAILYSFRNDVDFFMGRIFNTYGPYMQKDDGRVISNFINQAIRNEDITVYGDGLQTRSFCYIDDMVRLLKSLITHKGKYQLPFNIGNPVEYTMIETANEIIKLSKSDSKIKFFDLPKNDPLQRKPDITSVKNFFKWSPETTFNEGASKTIQYFENIRGI